MEKELTPYEMGENAVHDGESCPFTEGTEEWARWNRGFEQEMSAWEKFCENQ